MSKDWKPSSLELEGEGAVETLPKREVKPPRLYQVLLHNDDYTTMDFVVMILKTVFHHTEADAVRIMLNVHQKGVGVAGTYSYEIAESKAAKVMRLARGQDFPLRCSVELAS